MVHIRCRALRERGSGFSFEGSSWPFLGFLAATYSYQGSGMAIGDREPIGVIEAYICRGCGFTELYTRDVDRIPIGPEYATELVDSMPGGEGPYR
jgi:hypothetical protein